MSHRTIRSTLIASSLIFSFAAYSPAYAGTLIIGNGSTYPGDCTIGCMETYQQAYDSSYFGNSPVHLDTLSLFGGSGYYGTYQVSIGYMNGDYSSITTNFSSNFALTPVLVDSINLAGDMLNNILTIDLDFDYDPTAGDLLIQFSLTSASSSGNFAASSGYSWSRAYDWGSQYPSSHVNYADSGYALNSTFATSEVALVPEPETYAMMLAGLGLVGFMVKRRKQVEARSR